MDLVLVPVHLGMHWCLAVRSHVTFSPPGIETATYSGGSRSLDGGGGGGACPAGLLLWIHHWLISYPPPHLLAHLHVNLKLHPIESPPPNILKWIHFIMTFLLAVFKKPSKYKTYFDQHLYSLFRTVFFSLFPFTSSLKNPLRSHIIPAGPSSLKDGYV